MADWPRPCMTCGKSEVEITAEQVRQIVEDGKRKLIPYDLLHAPMTAKAPSNSPNLPSSPMRESAKPGEFSAIEKMVQGYIDNIKSEPVHHRAPDPRHESREYAEVPAWALKRLAAYLRSTRERESGDLVSQMRERIEGLQTEYGIGTDGFNGFSDAVTQMRRALDGVDSK